VGNWPYSAGQGYGGDVHYSALGNGSDVARWTFTVTPGRYRVSASWFAHANRASNSPYTVFNGSTVLGTVRVSQKVAANDFSNAGTSWEDLGGPYDITGNTLVVQLSDAANGYVIADAVRIEALDTTPPTISSVSSTSITSTGATITWTTNEASDTQVEYGTTTSYGLTTTLNSAMTTAHSQALTGLFASRLYHYRVKSKDASGNLSISGDFTFTTSAASVGAVWYVDNTATGLNIGTSWANAWTSFSSVVWGPSGVQAGDTLYISGGSTSQTYTESWSVGASGTAASPITIAVDASNPSHSGTVIFDYAHLGETTGGVGIRVLADYITFNGNVNGESHMEIRNLVNYRQRSTAVGINGYSVNGVTIQYVTFSNIGEAIWIHSSTGLDIHHNRFLQVRGDVAVGIGGATGAWDTNLVHDNEIELLWNMSVPPGGSGVYVGPDGIQLGHGTSVFNNVIRVKKTTLYTSTQHPDSIQWGNSRQVKIYNNDFINVGDSAIDLGGWSFDGTPVTFSDIWIYNNLFRITETIDSYPEFIRLYASPGTIGSITNLKILNNTFVDHDAQYPVITFAYNGNPTATGVEIKNNLWYNCGRGSQWQPVLSIPDSAGFTADSFSFDGNLYYHRANTPHIVFRDVDYTASAWVGAFEPRGTTAAPVFANYAPFAAGNDLHLQAGDAAARDGGVALNGYFNADKDGKSRPQGAAWDIGAYEYVP
jgi:hypothetical protein